MCEWIQKTEPDKDGRRYVHCIACDRGLPAPTSAKLDKIAGCLHPNRVPKGWEAGEWFSIFLESIFLTKRSWARLKSLCGFAPTCGCMSRQKALNKMGARVAGWFGSRKAAANDGNFPEDNRPSGARI